MSHKIEAWNEEISFINTKNSEWLLGKKELVIEGVSRGSLLYPGEVRSGIMKKVVELKRNMEFLETIPVSITQQVDLRIPVTMFPGIGWREKRIIVEAGYHIAPPIPDMAFYIDWVRTGVGKDNWRCYLGIPVFCHFNDILFFDGQNISVRKYRIPSIKLLRKIIKKVNLSFKGLYEFLGSYNEVYYHLFWAGTTSGPDVYAPELV